MNHCDEVMAEVFGSSTIERSTSDPVNQRKYGFVTGWHNCTREAMALLSETEARYKDRIKFASKCEEIEYASGLAFKELLEGLLHGHK